MAKVIATSADGSKVQISPTWGYAWNMCWKKSKGYKTMFVIGLILILIAVPCLLIWAAGHPVMGGGVNYGFFGLMALGSLLIFARPSQQMVDNQDWVDKKQYDRDFANGVDVDAKYFVRFWN